MGFPKHNQLPNPENPLFAEWRAKEIGFSPLVMCEFYEGFEVLQMQGKDTGEYIFGNYYNAKFVGSVYLGDALSPLQVAKLSQIYMPPTLNDLWEYEKEHGHEVCYLHFDSSQYAFILQNVLQKIKKT